jgi:hypothetical protein
MCLAVPGPSEPRSDNLGHQRILACHGCSSPVELGYSRLLGQARPSLCCWSTMADYLTRLDRERKLSTRANRSRERSCVVDYPQS